MLRYNNEKKQVEGTGKDKHLPALTVASIKSGYTAAQRRKQIEGLQLVIGALGGFGMVAGLGMRQPGDFYIDGRCSFGRDAANGMFNAVALLCAFAEASGYSIHGSSGPGKPLPQTDLDYAGWIVN